MTSLRSSRSLSNLQVSGLRFNQQDVPAGGGVLAVGGTGAAIISSAIKLASIDISSINVADINATTIDVSGLNTTLLTATTVNVSRLTGGTAVFSGDITAQDVNVLGTIQALDVSARYFDISGIKVGKNIDVSGEFRVEKTSTLKGPVTFLNTLDASGQDATFGSVTIQTDLSAASLYVSGGTTLKNIIAGSLYVAGGTTLQDLSAASLYVSGGTTLKNIIAGSLYVAGGTTLQDLSAASLYVSGPATFDTATMNKLNVRDIYIQNQIVDVSLGQMTNLLIDNILAGSGGVTSHIFDPRYPLDVSGGLRVGNVSGSYLRITPGTTGWTVLEPVGATGAGIAIAGDLSANFLTTSGITAGSIYSYGNITTPGNIYVYDVSARILDISGIRTTHNVDVSGAFTVEKGSLLKGGVTLWNALDVSGSALLRSGLRTLTPVTQSSGVAAGTTAAAGYVDTNALRIFTDGGGTGATLGRLQLPKGTTFPNGAAMVWNNEGLGGGSGNAQLVIGTGNGGGGKFNVYTGVTQQPVPVGIQPQMSLDASGSLTLTGATLTSSSATGFAIMSTNNTGNGTLAFHTTQNAGNPTERFFIDQNGYITTRHNTANAISDSRFHMQMGPEKTPSRFHFWAKKEPSNNNHTGNLSVINQNDVNITPVIKFDASDQAIYVTNSAETTKFISVSSGGSISANSNSVTITGNTTYTRSTNMDVIIQNAPSRNRIRFATGLTSGAFSPLVSNDDMAIIFDQNDLNTGSLVIGQWSNSARGIRISNTGLVYIGQDVQVPGTLTVNGSITASSIIQSGGGAIPTSISYKVAGSYSYTVPGTGSDIYTVIYTAMGGGGGGGGNGDSGSGTSYPPFCAGGGGGSGYFIQGQFSITGGTNISIGIGPGGAGGGFRNAGQNGSNTSITINSINIFSVSGGTGGAAGIRPLSGASLANLGNGGNGGYAGGGGGGHGSGTTYGYRGAPGGSGQSLPNNNINTNGANGGDGDGENGGAGGRGALGGIGGIASSNGGGGGGGGGPGGGAGGRAAQGQNPPKPEGGSSASQLGSGGGGAAGDDGGANQLSGGAGLNGYATFTFIKMV